jgi:hypothetical protein
LDCAENKGDYRAVHTKNYNYKLKYGLELSRWETMLSSKPPINSRGFLISFSFEDVEVSRRAFFPIVLMIN